MTWDSKPEDCPKVFNIHSKICEECSQKTECLQAMMGDKLDQYIKVQEKSLEQAEKWAKEQKEQSPRAGAIMPNMPKRDKKELLNEFLTDFCEFAESLNENLIAVGIKVEIPDLISLFMQWQMYYSYHKYDVKET